MDVYLLIYLHRPSKAALPIEQSHKTAFQTPLAARVFLPRLVSKSGYGPEQATKSGC